MYGLYFIEERKKRMFEITSPIEAGIPAESILRFIDRLDQRQVPMHALLLMRHGRLVAEGYYAPLHADSVQRMFSICKTLNALAIGLLAEEGRISLTDSIISYFPDKVPKDPHPWIAEMTVRDLLMMRTCHASTTYKYNEDKEWVETFFTTPPTHKPGTVFHYDTSAAHVLCVLTERLTGMSMLDYLRKKVLDRIGWSKDSYVLKNQFGDSQGGSGLMATARDMLLLGKLLLQQGNWEGEQLLPKEFVIEMTSRLTPNVLTGAVISERQGYGYQLWRSQHEGFVCYGLGGQLVLCLPKQDMILVTLADTQGQGGGNDLIYDSFYTEILPALDTAPLSEGEENRAAEQLKRRLSSLQLTPLYKQHTPLPADLPEDTFLTPLVRSTYINERTYMLSENPQGFTWFRFSFSEDSCRFSYCRNGNIGILTFGLKECLPGKLPFYDYYCAANGMWIQEDTLLVKVHLLDTVLGSLHMEFVFGEDDVTAYFKKIEESKLSEFNGHFYGKIN